MSEAAEDRILKLAVPAEAHMAPMVCQFVRQAAIRYGLEEASGQRLELIIEEGFMEAVKHGFDPGEEGELEISLLKRPGKLVVRIEDQGLPLDLRRLASSLETGLGWKLLHGFADEVRFFNLGKQGKRLEIAIRIAMEGAAELHAGDRVAEEAKVPKAPEDEELTIRLMERDEADLLSRCVYRSFGYSYTGEYIYYPERIQELMDGGLLRSCIAVNPSGEIVGHLGLAFVEKESRVGETCTAAVDPRYRGRSLFKHMKQHLAEHARQTGLYGLYSESVTIHPYTQKGNIAIGAKETGFLFGYTPASLEFHKLDRKRQADRQTVVLYYLRTNEEAPRDMYVPARYREIVGEIMDGLELARTAREEMSAGPVGAARIDIRMRPNWGHGFLSLLDYGEDDVEMVRTTLEDMKLRQLACIYLDLPLADPLTASRAERFRELGFFFAGIIPEYTSRGDVLRLQYLNNVAFDPDSVQVYSDFGKRLFEFALSEMPRP